MSGSALARARSTGAAPVRFFVDEVATDDAFSSARRPTPSFHRFATAAAALATIIAGCGVVGWWFHITALHTIVPGLPAMHFATAMSLLLLALASFVPRWPAAALGAVVGANAVVAMIGLELGVAIGPDGWYLGDGQQPMSLITAVAVLLLAAARTLVAVRSYRCAQFAGLGALLLAFLALVGYLYGSAGLYATRAVSTVALPTAVAVLLVCVATLAPVPGGVFARVLLARDSGGLLLRRLLPFAVIGLPAVGAVALVGQHRGWYEPATTIAVTTVAAAVLIGGLTWTAAQRVARADRTRARTMRELIELKEGLERQVVERAAALQRRHDEIVVLEDRQRIAADLHDIVIQRLFAAGMFLQSGAEALTGDARVRMETAVESMDAAIKDLRTSIFELGGGRHDARQDVRIAVEEVCDDVGRVLGFGPQLTLDDPTCAADLVRDDLLAVLREALSNVARHARASVVSVAVCGRDGVVSVRVVDDGVGIAGGGRRSGTANIAHRARSRGGDCTWTPVHPHGTALHWQVPLPDSVLA